MQILMPMAGRGQRFNEHNVENICKPLIDVSGKPMFQTALESVGLEGKYIFVILEEHAKEHGLTGIIKDVCSILKFVKDVEIIKTSRVTQGAACTCLLAKDLINNNLPLFITNCDQIDIWDRIGFMRKVNYSGYQGIILTFYSNSPTHSYVRLSSDLYVTQTAEKELISNIATTGSYFWKQGNWFVSCAEEMIKKNTRTNNEFYVCPVYNEAIEQGAEIGVYPVIEHHSLGTPEELKAYLASHKN